MRAITEAAQKRSGHGVVEVFFCFETGQNFAPIKKYVRHFLSNVFQHFEICSKSVLKMRSFYCWEQKLRVPWQSM
jgi:hypothetical protein